MSHWTPDRRNFLLVLNSKRNTSTNTNTIVTLGIEGIDKGIKTIRIAQLEYKKVVNRISIVILLS